MNAINVIEWVSGSNYDELVQLPGLPVAQQLQTFDTAGTGEGFILILIPMVEETVESDPDKVPVRFDVRSIPVVKIRAAWYKPSDDNVADALAALIRMLAPQT